MFQKILVPTDFSPSADAALDLARRAFPQARLSILHVQDVRAMGVPDLSTGGLAPVIPPVDVQQEIGQAERERLRALTLEGEEADMLVGDPVQGILKAARDLGVDLIVMGTHGRGGLAHLFLGSVTETVVRESPVPVLTIRHA
jgi:nucleotide-binding universal stress UspA family protein